jgi:hypothetical protein
MPTATMAEITISRAYRIHVEGRLIGFVWRHYGDAWMHNRSTEVFPGRHPAVVALLNYDDGQETP